MCTDFAANFRDTDAIELVRRDILLLTDVLKGVRDGNPSASQGKSGSKPTPWSHVSYLLSLDAGHCTEHGADRFLDSTVAVTGCITKQQVTVAVVSQNKVPSSSARVVVERLTSHCDETVERLLSIEDDTKYVFILLLA